MKITVWKANYNKATAINEKDIEDEVKKQLSDGKEDIFVRRSGPQKMNTGVWVKAEEARRYSQKYEN